MFLKFILSMNIVWKYIKNILMDIVQGVCSNKSQMEFEMGRIIGSCNEHEEDSNSRNAHKKSYHRHTNHQIAQLEGFFKECPHPDENQRRLLGRELGLDPKQVKFWFQNKRTQTKAQHERADNNVLRAENERIQCENIAIREALRNVICPACGGPPFGQEERQHSLQKLQLENAQLKEEHEKVSNLLAKYTGKPLSEIERLTSGIPSSAESSFDLQPPALRQGSSSSLNMENAKMNQFHNNHHFRGIIEMERGLMVETAAGAMDELIKLIRIDQPLWTRASSSSATTDHGDGRGYTLHRDSYNKIFPQRDTTNHFPCPSSARFESSKHSGMVAMNAAQLVDIFLDSNKWVDLFTTIITKARTIEVLEKGDSGNRHAALQMMYEQMHVLSPHVPSREFYFLRHCQQFEVGSWAIVDVSYEISRESNSCSRCWKFPSGCIIQDMSNGCSKVSWVEHVQVDDKIQTHRLYRDVVCNNTAYGAERWIVSLERMIERFTYCSKVIDSNVPAFHEFGGVISLAEGKKSITKLGHRMVKSFCGMLGMSGKMDFPHLSEVNNSGVRVSVRKSTAPGQPFGIIVSAATSLWLPLPHLTLFDFFTQHKSRLQWDVLSNGHPIHEIAHIPTGANPKNCISILRPFIPSENSILMVQESYVDALGSFVIYAPIDVPTLNIAISGENSSNIPILPSGIIICGDGRTEHSSTGTANVEALTSNSSNTTNASSSVGSLLTVAFQILVSNPLSSKQLINMDSVATVNTLISSTVQKIKSSLSCSTQE
ncbi:homeobox-leucine zipper protein ROC8-like [Humulus lupulus]|uniref:homeobox-leucine zipper protein ROC8-like n=1 Tax=Humulus lupulus TaxID=3486 RepID=UPI002B415379|nr:homeobox-leucine zipper protein ROC8-like [Humulus lupulus]